MSIHSSELDPIRAFTHENIAFRVYESEDEMGLASARSLAALQRELVASNGQVSLLLMAAPSAYSFFNAYVGLVEDSVDLKEALFYTHFYQFDDYPLPRTHPASFRYLLSTKFFDRIGNWCPTENFHFLNADDDNRLRVCSDYTDEVLASGPDLQLKGMGENGHWGFHEPGISIEDAPRYIQVNLSEENVQQQLRDHPALFANKKDIPRTALTANVPLFLKTRVRIEDNIPQSAKAFAVLAAYGSEVVHTTVPSSSLKRHRNATVRTTLAAGWALLEYLDRGVLRASSLHRMVQDLAGDDIRAQESVETYVRATLRTMAIRVEK